jgi:hypothetical protein
MRRENGPDVAIIRGTSGFIVNAHSDVYSQPETHGATTVDEALAIARKILLAGAEPASAGTLSPTDARFWGRNKSHEQESQS